METGTLEVRFTNKVLDEIFDRYSIEELRPFEFEDEEGKWCFVHYDAFWKPILKSEEMSTPINIQYATKSIIGMFENTFSAYNDGVCDNNDDITREKFLKELILREEEITGNFEYFYWNNNYECSKNEDDSITDYLSIALEKGQIRNNQLDFNYIILSETCSLIDNISVFIVKLDIDGYIINLTDEIIKEKTKYIKLNEADNKSDISLQYYITTDFTLDRSFLKREIWTLDNTNKYLSKNNNTEILVISNKKAVESLSISSDARIKKIIIDEGVEVILNGAFKENNFVEEIFISSTVKK